MTPWQPPLQHGYGWDPIGAAHRSSPGAGESKDGAGGSGSRVLQFPKGWGRAGQGGFQLVLEAHRTYKSGEPHPGTCSNETRAQVSCQLKASRDSSVTWGWVQVKLG